MIENTLITAITGIAIIIVSVHRGLKILGFRGILQFLGKAARDSNLDLSGNTVYPDSISHQWLMKSVVSNRPGKMKMWFREQVDNNTIVMFSVFAFLMFTFSMLITSILVSSVILTGIQAGIFLVGTLIIFGTGDPRMSESLLDMLERTEKAKLSERDYPYARIANRKAIHSLIITCVLGFIFILSSLWIDVIIEFLAYIIAWFSYAAIITPATAMARVNMGLAIAYMAAVLPFLMYTVLKITQMIYPHQRDFGSPNPIYTKRG
ncbi:MAG: hypothetical protein P1Q69_13480 [Candidatus Thorarchaeota archaeon]|nr:hypothetical protein [Candidatus Thorarchaeota archaeon]